MKKISNSKKKMISDISLWLSLISLCIALFYHFYLTIISNFKFITDIIKSYKLYIERSKLLDSIIANLIISIVLIIAIFPKKLFGKESAEGIRDIEILFFYIVCVLFIPISYAISISKIHIYVLLFALCVFLFLFSALIAPVAEKQIEENNNEFENEEEFDDRID